MITGFQDFLVINAYNHYVLGIKGGVPMTSDTVDMLWHAWLEEPNYNRFFKELLGFELSHIPEKDKDKLTPLKGNNGLSFLEKNLHLILFGLIIY